MFHFNLATIVTFVSLIFTVFGCATTSPGVASVTQSTSLKDDSVYFPVLKKWTRSAQSFREFQNRGNLNVTLITDEFRRAYQVRLENILGRKSDFEGVGAGKLGFVVSGFTPDEPFKEYDNKQFWTVTLRYGDRILEPSGARTMVPKAAFEPMFDYIHKWSTDYLFVFDLAAGDQFGTSNAVPQKVSLEFKSSISNFLFEWVQ